MGNCVTVIRPDEVAAVESCGKFDGILYPGCHCRFDVCGCCVNFRKVSTRVLENKVVCDTKTEDNVFVRVDVVVQQAIIIDSPDQGGGNGGQQQNQTSSTRDAIYKLSDPYAQIESYVANVIRGQVPKLKLDEVFTMKDELADAVRDDLEAKMKEFGYEIHNVLVTDIAPDHRVRAAMNEINANRRLRVAANDKAEADKILLVKAAEAEAEAKFLQGQGIAKQRAAIIDGLKEGLRGSSSVKKDGSSSDSSEPQDQELKPERVTELLLITQYFDTLEKMANGTATTVFLPHSVGNLASMADQIRGGILEGEAAKKCFQEQNYGATATSTSQSSSKTTATPQD